MSENILVERDGFVGIITINRPEKLNAVTPEMAGALVAAVTEFNTDDNVRCVILTGAGEKAFCAGSDIRTLDDYDTPWNFRNRPDYCDAIRALLKPSIAAVNGYAFGGGLETAMTCDGGQSRPCNWPVERRTDDHDRRSHRRRDCREMGARLPRRAARQPPG
jgi:enoyl-CoA hydratase/carnithine racemase